MLASEKPANSTDTGRPGYSKLARVSSLDALRGLLLICSVGVNSLPFTPASIAHHPWAGVHLIDLIFPFFVTMTGCGIAFAYRNGVTSWVRVLRRVVVLFALGLLYNAVTSNQWDLESWRITGVLQLYAIVIGLVSIGHVWLRSWQKWLAITIGLVVVYTVILVVVAHGCANGAITPECNPSLWETKLFGGAHSYRLGASGHDPEGIVATFGALISVAAGATIGHAIVGGMKSPPRSPAGTARVLGVIVGVFVAVAILAILAPYLTGAEPMPIMKRLWTPPFALFVACGVAISLFLLHLYLDIAREPMKSRRLRAAYSLEALGKNSLLVYFGSHVLNSILSLFPSRVHSFMGWLIDITGSGLISQISITVFMIAAWMGIAVVLHRNRIYLRA